MEIGRKEVDKKGFKVLGMGKTTVCFQEIGKAECEEMVKEKDVYKRESRHWGKQRRIREIIENSRGKFNMLENILEIQRELIKGESRRNGT